MIEPARSAALVARIALAVALIAGVAGAAACGGSASGVRRHAVARSNTAVPRSPCRGVDPWTGTALRCATLVSRWAPVHSLRLTFRVPARVRSTCEQARRHARIPVVCPPLVPAGGVVADPGLYGAEGPLTPRAPGGFYLLTFNNGENAGHIHWIVGAGPDQTVRRNLLDPRIWEVPGRVRRLGERRYGPWQMTFYRLPPHPAGGQLGGHDLALAQRRGLTYFASVHGRTHHDADAAMLIAMLLTARSSR